MKICLISTFPPSHRGLSEYGFHIARELRKNPLLDLTILADVLHNPQAELDGFNVVRCWNFNAFRNPAKLLREVRRVNPDLVWLNLGFATFGDKPVQAFLGLVIPPLIRLMGYQTHITLHQLMDSVDLNDAGVRNPRLYRLAGLLITRILLLANSVSVLLPEYRSLLQSKYGADRVYVRPHGVLAGEPEYPNFTLRGNPRHRILAFGKWGTYKRPEMLLDVFQIVAQEFPDAHLIIAGGDHPKTPGYVKSVAERYAGDPRIEFTGYVPEEAIGDLFRCASIMVMPYTSSSGSSGVAHLACQYGVPILSPAIHDFQQLAMTEGLAMEFFPPGEPREMATRLVALLKQPEKLEQMSLQNFAVGLHMTMPKIIRDYVRTFDVEDRIHKMRSIARYRRYPRWLPMRDRWARWQWDGRLARDLWLPAPHTLQPDGLNDAAAEKMRSVPQRIE
jgi:glycosyltransferase involved in cell wall biosynthesis